MIRARLPGCRFLRVLAEEFVNAWTLLPAIREKGRPHCGGALFSLLRRSKITLSLEVFLHAVMIANKIEKQCFRLTLHFLEHHSDFQSSSVARCEPAFIKTFSLTQVPDSQPQMKVRASETFSDGFNCFIYLLTIKATLRNQAVERLAAKRRERRIAVRRPVGLCRL